MRRFAAILAIASVVVVIGSLAAADYADASAPAQEKTERFVVMEMFSREA
jgi:hypothetical protein